MRDEKFESLEINRTKYFDNMLAFLWNLPCNHQKERSYVPGLIHKQN